MARGVLTQSPEPDAHDIVLDNNPDPIGIWRCWFLGRGENRSTRRKTSRSKDENQQRLNPHMTPSPGIKPGPHWWEASALTTAPSLLPTLEVYASSNYYWLIALSGNYQKNRPPHKHKVLTVMYPCSRAAKETIILKNIVLDFHQL